MQVVEMLNLSIQQAADTLNVSRLFLIAMIDKGEIECIRVGQHCRIETEALFAYKRKRDDERAAALSALAALDVDLI